MDVNSWKSLIAEKETIRLGHENFLTMMKHPFVNDNFSAAFSLEVQPQENLTMAGKCFNNEICVYSIPANCIKRNI